MASAEEKEKTTLAMMQELETAVTQGKGYYLSYYSYCSGCKKCVICAANKLGTLLTENRIAVETINTLGETIVEVAARKANWLAVSTLMQRGALVKDKNILTDKEGTLRPAVLEIDSFNNLFRDLMARNYDFGRCDALGRNILIQYLLQAKSHSASMYHTMMRGGALPYVKDTFGKTAIVYAIERGFEETDGLIISAILTNLGSDEERVLAVTTPAACGCPPLVYVWNKALQRNTVKHFKVAETMTEVLMNAGASMNVHACLECGGDTCLARLVQSNRWCHEGGKKVEGFNPCQLLTRSITKWGGLQLDLKSRKDGKTALMLAAENDMFQFCKILVDKGARDVAIPLTYLTPRIIQILLRQGAPHTLAECKTLAPHDSVFRMQCSTCKLKLPRTAFSGSQQCRSDKACYRCMRVPYPGDRAMSKDPLPKYIPRRVESLQQLAALAFFQTRCFGCLDDTLLPVRVRELLKEQKYIGEVWERRFKTERQQATAIVEAAKKKT